MAIGVLGMSIELIYFTTCFFLTIDFSQLSLHLVRLVRVRIFIADLFETDSRLLHSTIEVLPAMVPNLMLT